MKVLSNLEFNGSHITLDNVASFPTSPTDGQMALVSGIVYIYTSLSGVTTWYPISNESTYFIHTQGVASTNWRIIHNLNTTNFIFFVYDSNGNLMQGDYVPVDNNEFDLNFTVARSGKAVVFVAADRYVPSITATDLKVQNIVNEITGLNGLSFMPNGDIKFNGNLVPTQNSVFSIGSLTSKVKDLFLSAATLHLGDNTTIKGTSITVDAGLNPTTLAEVPTIIGSKIIAKPFTYNPTPTSSVKVNPSIEFQNDNGDSFPISFISTPGSEKFSFDSPLGAGQATLVAKSVETAGITLAGYTFGATEFKVNNDLRVDGNVNLGYDINQTITLHSPLVATSNISLLNGATIGDGNDNVVINTGAANTLSITGDVNLNSRSIKNLALPVLGTDAANKQYVDTASGNLQSQITTNVGNITGLGNTKADKTYVDSLVSGLNFKDSVVISTTTNIVLSGLQTIDGISVVAGDRVLVKNQTLGTENGIYVASATAWARSTDADNTPANEVSGGMFCFVENGTLNSGTGWVMRAPIGAAILGTDNLVFSKFTDTVLNAGEVLTKMKTVDGSGSGLDADLLDGHDSTYFLSVTGKAADANLLDGLDSTYFLPVTGKAADANLLDGIDSTQFLRSDISSTPSTNNTVSLGSAAMVFNAMHATTFYGTSTAAQLADLAEMYTCKDVLPAGTIVTIPEDEAFEVQTATSTDVPFGVVSDKPGYLLNSSTEGVPVALSGRTSVLVKGPIKKGEFIQLHDNGTAVKASVTDLTLGRALETDLSESTKLVMCYVKAV